MRSQSSYSSISEALLAIQSSAMDSTFENIAAFYLQSLGREDKWRYIEALLTSPRSKTRALGLRVTCRGVREKALLERVIWLSFSVDRLAELQCWYAAILARYSVSLFGRMLRDEMERRRDANFAELHLRALEMHRMKGNKAKAIVLERLKGFAIEQGLASPRTVQSHQTERH